MNLEFNDWTPRFYRRMQEEKEAREAWKKLIDRKCNQAALSLLLWQKEFKKHLDKELEATDIKLQIRAYEASLEVRKLTSTLARLRETYFEIDEEITVAARLCGAIAGHLQGKALTSHPRTQLFDLPLLAAGPK